MHTKIIISALVTAFLCCLLNLNCSFVEKATETAKVVTGEVDKWTGQEESEPATEGGNGETENPSSTQKPKGTNQKPGTTSPSQKPVLNKLPTIGGQNDASVTLSPGTSKTADINGASASLSNSMADYTIKVTGCRGSKSDQSVTIYFTVQHGLADQYLAVRASRCKAFAGGIDYNKFATKVGVKKNNNTVPYNVEVSCEATIQYVPPSVQSFESVSVDLYTAHDGGNGKGKKTGKLELRNLKVAWQ